MALLTPIDRQSLQSWSFLADYQRRRGDLINIARAVYSAINFLLGSPPQPSDCADALTSALFATKPFADFLQRRNHAHPNLHWTFAVQMARLVLDSDWTEIIKQ